MPLKVNTQAPDFTLPSTKGEDFSLSKSAADSPLIIFFYPKDFTRGCTKEVCEFRDTFSFFEQLNIRVIGISRDSLQNHYKFKKAYNLPFELLSDKEGKVARLYEASFPLIRLTKRITYLLNSEHKIVAIYESLFGATSHIQEMVAQVKKGTY